MTHYSSVLTWKKEKKKNKYKKYKYRDNNDLDEWAHPWTNTQKHKSNRAELCVPNEELDHDIVSLQLHH